MAGDGGGQLGPAACAEFAQGTGHVILDGAGADAEPGRYLRVGEARGDEVIEGRSGDQAKHCCGERRLNE